MRKALLAAVAAAMFACSPAPAFAAPVCQPLPEIAKQLIEIGVKREQVFATSDPSFVRVYHASLGINMPADAVPVGMIAVVTDKLAIVGIVEDRDGKFVRYTIRIDLGAHKKAFAAAKVTA